MILKKKVRHIYDLHQLLQKKEFSDFFNSFSFEQMLLKVGKDDVISYKNNNEWLFIHPKEALIFNNLEYVWGKLKDTYIRNFKNMVYGTFPDDLVVLNTLRRIKQRLLHINWNIK